MVGVPGAAATPIRQWQLLITLGWANFLSHLATQGIHPLAPFVVERFSIGAVGWGTLVTAGTGAAALASIVGGSIGDTTSLRGVLFWGSLTLGVSFAASAFATSYFLFFAALLLAGIMAGVTIPAINRGIVDGFGPSRRGVAMGTKQAMITLLGAASATVTALIAVEAGLAAALVLLSIVALVSGVFCAVTIPMPKSSATQAAVADREARIHESRPNRLVLAAATFFMGGAQQMFIAYLVLYLHLGLGFELVPASLALSASYIVGTVGRVAWGGVADMVFGGGRRTVLLLITTLSAVSAALLAATELGASQWIAFALAGILGFAVLGWYAVVLTALGEAGGRANVSRSIGRGLAFGFLGQSLGPILFGALVDLTGHYASGWVMVAGWATAASVLLLFVRERPARREPAISAVG